MTAWYDLSTERPIGMAEGFIPHSKIREYAEITLGLIGDEIDQFVAIMRRVDNNHMSKPVIDPEMTDRAEDASDVKRVVSNVSKNRPKMPTKKPRVRYPR